VIQSTAAKSRASAGKQGSTNPAATNSEAAFSVPVSVKPRPVVAPSRFTLPSSGNATDFNNTSRSAGQRAAIHAAIESLVASQQCGNSDSASGSSAATKSYAETIGHAPLPHTVIAASRVATTEASGSTSASSDSFSCIARNASQ